MQLAPMLAVIALISVFVLSTTVSIVSLFNARKVDPLQGYLLAGGGLSRPSLISLLLSASFGLNALFYAAWLGYAIGLWAVIIQIAWSVSFFFLARHVSIIRRHKSLHELLGIRFGPKTRIVAGLCSILGIMYFIGWEVGIGRATIGGLIETTSPSGPATISSEWLIAGVVFGSLLYTVLGGLRGNAAADIVQNLLKIIVICFLTYLLFGRFLVQSQSSMRHALFPPFETIGTTPGLGWWAFVTNILFNLAWQFVDNSTWQSIIGSAKATSEDIAKTVRLSGLSIFLVPNLIATILGASLAGTPEIDPNNILVKAVSLVPNLSWFVLLLVFIAVTASVMSVIDGYFLASAYALIIDVIHPTENVADLDKDPQRAKRLLLVVRLGLVLLAVTAIWGVKALLELLELNLFDFVYIVIITQLSLLGPVVMALLSNRISRFPLWIPIVAALFIGFGSVYLGTIHEYRWAIDAAGTFAILSSCILAFIGTKKNPIVLEAEEC